MFSAAAAVAALYLRHSVIFFNYERLKLQSNFYLPFILQRQVAFSKMKCTHTQTDRKIGRKMVRKLERNGKR